MCNKLYYSLNKTIVALIVYLVKSTKHATVKLQASAISSVTMESQLR